MNETKRKLGENEIALPLINRKMAENEVPLTDCGGNEYGEELPR